jgi:5'(3')-deoxyribonucleotidase
VCYRCGKFGHFIAKCPYSSESDRDEDKKGKKKMEKKKCYKKKGGETHMGREWDSNESSTDSSSDEDAANITINKGLLFPNVSHKCLMAKDGKKKKVYSRATPKYTTSDDEDSSSDNEDDLISLFANLSMDQKKKLNELIETINEKDDLLECQEDLIVKENKKFVKLKNAYALEVEKCENLYRELSICNDSISCLRDENASLNAKINELNVCMPSTSTIEHITICTRCRDVNVEAIVDHLAMIKQQNDHIATLNAKIAQQELENEKFKFATSMLYNGRRPGIKDGIGFQQGSQNNTKLSVPKKLSNFVKGKAPMVQDREGYILYPANYPEHKISKIHSRKPHNVSHHAFMYKNEASSSRHSTHIKMPKKKIPNASNEHNISYKTFDASYVLTNKSGKVVAKYVGGKHKSPKTCVWVPKVLVSNVKGSKTI